MTTTTATQLPAEWRDFFALTKPRVMSLVVFTGLCGLLAAPGGIAPVIGFTAVLCIAMGAGGAGAQGARSPAAAKRIKCSAARSRCCCSVTPLLRLITPKSAMA